MDNFLLSFLIMMLWSLIFTGMFLGMRKTKIFRSKIGISGSILICTILLVRMAIPFDIGIARRIHVDWPWFLEGYKILNMEPHRIGPISLTIIQMIALVLGIVAVILVIRFMVAYFNLLAACRQSIVREDVEYKSVLQKTCERLNYRHEILLVKSSEVHSPMCVGVRTNYIILPETEFNEKELEYIFTHEITHLKYHDLYYRLAANLLNCVFWWNPLIYVVKDQLEYALEVRCDIRVTADYTSKERRTYLETILKVLDDKGEKKTPLIRNMTGFASYGYNCAMEERFKAVLAQEPVNGNSKIAFHIWCIGMLGLLLCSYMFIVMPHYNADTGPGQQIYDNDMWLTIDENGDYIVHYWENGKQVKQKLNKDKISVVEEYMEVREE